MEPSLDVRKVAYELLEERKAFLQENDFLPSYGWVVEPSGRSTAMELDLDNKEARKESRRELRQLARDKKAVAIITITDRTYRVFLPEPGTPLTTFDDPELAEAWNPDGIPKPCVSADIEVEGQTTTNVLVPYWRDKLGSIVFGPAEEGPIEFKGPEPPLPGDEEGPKD